MAWVIEVREEDGSFTPWDIYSTRELARSNARRLPEETRIRQYEAV